MSSTHLSLHCHVIFGTKHQRPLIAQEWRCRLHAYIGGTIRTLDVIPEAVGGVADHVHPLPLPNSGCHSFGSGSGCFGIKPRDSKLRRATVLAPSHLFGAGGTWFGTAATLLKASQPPFDTCGDRSGTPGSMVRTGGDLFETPVPRFASGGDPFATPGAEFKLSGASVHL